MDELHVPGNPSRATPLGMEAGDLKPAGSVLRGGSPSRMEGLTRGKVPGAGPV